jgi:phage N-6-adenine-methyltransferase
MVHERKDGNTVDKDEARTPPSLFKKLDQRWKFAVDLACTRLNCMVHSGIFHDEGYDTLKMDWNRIIELGQVRGEDNFSGYCNPPYSNPEPFIVKAYEESLKGVAIVMLLPSDTSTKVFHHYTMKASEIIFTEGRVKFNNPDGTPMKGAPKFGNMVVVFDKAAREKNGRLIVSSMTWK